jgi:hypothetical protein
MIVKRDCLRREPVGEGRGKGEGDGGEHIEVCGVYV